MAEPLPPEMIARLQSLTAQGRRDIERHLFPRRTRAFGTVTLRSIGAVAIGLLSAGIAVFCVVVILNLVFHYGA